MAKLYYGKLEQLFVITMMQINYIFRKCTGAMDLQNHKRLITLCTPIISNCLQKMKKYLNTLFSSQDIAMEFSIEKYAILIIKRGKKEITEGIGLLHQESIKMFGKKENYKYLGILEVDNI